MTPERKANLQRLFNPKHIAVIGGTDAEAVAVESQRMGYRGQLWPVNPKRKTLGGHECFPSAEDLPEAPDAVFLAIPREPAIETVDRLRQMGAGGIVCYTAGFKEVGEQGAGAEDALMNACGEMALVGPNCYGILNYLDRVALWPFAHGGNCPGFGAAIITQSGMLASDLTMSQRSLPLAFMISAGNQALLSIEDYILHLCEREEIRSIGIHVEGIRDWYAFEEASVKAMDHDIPIVVLKSGSSSIGSELTLTHTGSISGADHIYSALFERLGIIRVDNASEFLETLKYLSVSRLPKGNRVAGLTCSGGEAAMLADMGEKEGLDFKQPGETTKEILASLLPHTATASNPLDYTTPIWGIPEKTVPVFKCLIKDGYDMAIIVQDYPTEELDESRASYVNDSRAFVAAVKATGIPGAVCSVIPENLDSDIRKELIAEGIAPMQGIHDCINAVSKAIWHAERRKTIKQSEFPRLYRFTKSSNCITILNELEGKQMLSNSGVPIPPYASVKGLEIKQLPNQLSFPLVAKMISRDLSHKTEAGSVMVGLEDHEAVNRALKTMTDSVRRYKPEALTDEFLLEKQMESPLVELLVNVKKNTEYGTVLTMASGGIFVELLEDAVHLLLPTSSQEIERELGRLKISRLMEGFRGRPPVQMNHLLEVINQIINCALEPENQIIELEINPLFVLPDYAIAVDTLIQVESDASH